MNNEMQFLRWSLPGSIFIMVILSYWLVHSSFRFNLFIGDNSLVGWIVAIVVGISIPIGYLLYQVYFVFRWWYKDDNHLIEQTIENVLGFDSTEISNYSSQITNKIIKPKRQVKEWPVIESYWYYTILGSKIEEKSIIFDRYNHLLTSFHSLGASMASIVLGHITSFFIYFVLMESVIIFAKLIEGIIIFLLWIIIGSILYVNRKYVRHNITVFHNYSLKKLVNQR